MKRTWMRHATAVTTLATALALAAPTRAAVRAEWLPASDLVHAAWSWLAGLWETPRRAEPERPSPVRQKEGGCIDPMGRPLCHNQSVTGGGLDPGDS